MPHGRITVLRGGPRAGQSSDCTEYPATNGCLPVQWPGWNTTAWNQEAEKPATVGSERFWFGSLSVGMRDASGQLYMRNRYYNPQTGQFTQPDPIGLAGGLNSYGFAAGDPVSYSDPYGLSPQDVIIACRNVDNTGGVGGHCAIRIVNTKRNIDVTYELLNVSGFGEPQFAGRTSAANAARYLGRGVKVDVPDGMTSDDFDLRVLATAERVSRERNGDGYSPLGHRNSNRFVYDVITQSGGEVPWAAVPYSRATPGICGGSWFALGTGCSGDRNDGTYLPPEN